MDADIQFGEVEETEISRSLRPDRNRHYAVVPCGRPAKKDLPVFVDLDVMRDMEEHAQFDTSVELGGVMLGGQHEDEQGNPFVFVTESLRAEHYRATKGSFEFTHDTWETISRQRDEFPAELQMVGWYHTHPDWGVFLSTMDLFICDNFFNRPLDLALVIDPCQGDRGFFQWTKGERPKTDRIDGFYLVASRFRRDELQWYADQLEGEPVMQADAGRGYLPQRMPAPVVNISDSRSGWLGVAVIGMLVLQACLMMLVAWRVLLPPIPAAPAAAVAESEAIEDLRQRLDAMQLERSAEERLAAQRKLLDRVLDEVEVAPGGLVTSLEEERAENEALQDDLQLVRAGYRAITQEKVELDAKVAKLEQDLGKLAAEKTELERLNEAQIDRLNAKIAALNKQVDELKPRPEDTDAEAESNGAAGGGTWSPILLIVIASVVLLAGIGGVGFFWWRGRPTGDDDPLATASTDDDRDQDGGHEVEDEPHRDAEE
jgi:proteasome lid subunit RPN8/RPN11